MFDVAVRDMDWDNIPDMGEQALAGYETADQPLFRKVRDALCRHNCLDKFGLFLVHKHFQMSADEKLVEHVDFVRRRVVVQVMSDFELSDRRIIPTNWIFGSDAENDGVGIMVAQWGFADDLIDAVDPLSSEYAACFEEVRTILAADGPVDRFGMFLIRNQMEFEEGNQLECTDHEARTLTLTPQPPAEDRDSVLPTNWIFTPDETVAVNCCECARNSGGHLGYHRQR